MGKVRIEVEFYQVVDNVLPTASDIGVFLFNIIKLVDLRYKPLWDYCCI